MTYLAAFFTQSGAIAFERRATKAGLSAELIPAPRRLSASCGLCVRLEAENPPLALADADTDKIFALEGAEYRLVYDCDAPA